MVVGVPLGDACVGTDPESHAAHAQMAATRNTQDFVIQSPPSIDVSGTKGQVGASTR
jgi:hypothetical protein